MKAKHTVEVELGEAPDPRVVETVTRTWLWSLGIIAGTIIAVALIWAVVQMNAPPQPSEPRRTEAGADVAAKVLP